VRRLDAALRPLTRTYAAPWSINVTLDVYGAPPVPTSVPIMQWRRLAAALQGAFGTGIYKAEG